MTIDEKALVRAVKRAMENAGTLPAKDAVKLVPADWHRICDLVLSPAKQKEADGWRTMESAPKDGTEVLLYGPGVLNSDGRTSMYARARHVGWAVEIEGHLHWYTRDPHVTCRPTAWRPLPEPPSALLSAGGEG